MVHAPLRALAVLARTTVIVGAAVAIPYVLKRCKPVAKNLGDTLVKIGEDLRKSSDDPARESRTATPKAETAPKPKKAATAKPKKPGKTSSRTRRTPKAQSK
ncbi:MAG: hypothetical protein L6Q31_03975 [Fimbriimonadaceae bacterium]|uniref:Uncharacterized protein n=1 Tax=Candidatus Nitrosymbiomonas proteolyticus TaxID=2608984 RepID=A0A809S3X1_9BACT|nr:hypothetical protein [Fimbriimonadaceae bacterium]NUM39423.1 hypothetical protein [Armatimonadota bacterium]BBO23317.1 conserved hypothetical protein [Candidatus Nitrosymbiomonas proteolyticus]